MIKKCPNCLNEIEYLNYEADYYEESEGWSSGTCNFEGSDLEMNNSEIRDTINIEETNIEYLCPECNYIIILDELLDVDEDEDENEEINNTDYSIENMIKNI